MRRRTKGLAIAASLGAALVVLGGSSFLPPGSTVYVALHPGWWPTPAVAWAPSTMTTGVPVPPGARKSVAAFPLPIDPLPGAAHVMVGEAEYRVPMASGVGAWYDRAFARRDWASSGSAQSGNASGIASQMESFTPSLHATGLTVNVSWAPDGAGSSLVQYWITDVLFPPRPASAHLPSNIVKVVLHPIDNVSARSLSRTETNPAWIERLVRLVNALPTSPGGVSFGCPPTGGVALTLYPQNGPPIALTASCYTVAVKGTLLADSHFAVGKMVEAQFPASTFGG